MQVSHIDQPLADETFLVKIKIYLCSYLSIYVSICLDMCTVVLLVVHLLL